MPQLMRQLQTKKQTPTLKGCVHEKDYIPNLRIAGYRVPAVRARWALMASSAARTCSA